MERDVSKLALVSWMLAIAISLALLVVTAASRPGNVAMGYAHLAVSGASCLLFALLAIRELRNAERSGANRTALAVHSARLIGAVWSWAALAMVLTYGFDVMPAWREWKAHLLAMLVIASLCYGVAVLLSRSAASGRDDETLLKLARLLAIGQLAAMLAVMVGLAVDGHMRRFLTERYVDWPAKHVMFFGAMAIAAISAASLKKRS